MTAKFEYVDHGWRRIVALNIVNYIIKNYDSLKNVPIGGDESLIIDSAMLIDWLDSKGLWDPETNDLLSVFVNEYYRYIKINIIIGVHYFEILRVFKDIKTIEEKGKNE